MPGCTTLAVEAPLCIRTELDRAVDEGIVISAVRTRGNGAGVPGGTSKRP